MSGKISVDVYYIRHAEPHSMVQELLHVNGWKSGTDTYPDTQIDNGEKTRRGFAAVHCNLAKKRASGLF